MSIGISNTEIEYELQVCHSNCFQRKRITSKNYRLGRSSTLGA